MEETRTTLGSTITLSTDNDPSQITNRLIEVHKSVLANTERYENFHCSFDKTQNDIEMHKQALESIGELIAVFENHIKLNETLQAECLPHEVDAMVKNRKLSIEKRDEYVAKKTEIERTLKHATASARSLDREMNVLKPELNRLQKERDSLKEALQSAGVPVKTIDNFLYQALSETNQRQTRVTDLKADESCNYVEVEIARKDPTSHEIESNWLIQDCDRTGAEKLLAGRRSGTFLIRNSRKGQLALSIVVNRKVYHCLIYKTDRGFGFAEPYDIHPTLKSLVLHYSQTSLEEHNDHLHTTLAYPIFAEEQSSEA
ncbi:phosphatidylinositol 3-kinase regulatory subunit alpha [Brevipalpus obovatus]|uniref:phosphatidylinositol 3-kinase regulatory subunit alpha n=1 Tax=Brevipalpus obovatus TaxID=246614 RepID=UPI003D9F62D1